MCMFCRSLFALLAIVLSVLRFTDSDYSFGIFKLFLTVLKSVINSDIRFTGCGISMTGCSARLTGCDIKMISFYIRITNCSLRLTGCDISMTNCSIRVTGCGIGVTGWVLE